MFHTGMNPEPDGVQLDLIAAQPPYPYREPLPVAVRDSHLRRIRLYRRRYFRWGFLVATPGIVLFSISMFGLLGRSVGKTPLFVSHPTLAGWFFSSGVLLMAVGIAGCFRTHRPVQHHFTLLVAYGVPARQTGVGSLLSSMK